MTEKRVTNRLAQPPTFHLNLFDEERKVGWVSSHALGFRGFETEDEAMHAAYLAHRTLSRRVAHRRGRRPMPIVTEPLRLSSDDTLHAAGRRIGAIVRPGPGSKSAPDSFGFELPFPEPVEEVMARSKCAHVYRALRRSGIRWAMWRTGRPSREAVGVSAPRVESSDPQPATPFMPFMPWGLGTIAISSVALLGASLVSPDRISTSLAGVALAGLIGLRLFAMTPRWPLRPARPPYAMRNSNRGFQ